MNRQAFRNNMVATLREMGIVDSQVLDAMNRIKRHRFVDTGLLSQAYEESSLPIGWGQTISKPSVVARMLELLCEGTEGRLGRVLEIGTGCGYQAALLSLLATEVYSMERLRDLQERARTHLRHLRLTNVHLLFGDGTSGYPQGAPYAGIIAAAVGDAIPHAWTDQLAVGGHLVAPVTTGGAGSFTQSLLHIEKTSQGLRQTLLEDVCFVPLKFGTA